MFGISGENPWAIESIDDCIFYCCPECDDKSTSKRSFLSHAWDKHPTVISVTFVTNCKI